LRISLPPNFSFDAVVRSHGWYDLPPFSYDAGAGVLTTRLPSGEVVFRGRDGFLEAKGPGVSRAELSRATRRIFSLDVDLSEGAHRFADVPELVRGLARGGGRMLRAPGLFEDAVKMLFTTNCSWAATRGMVVRLIELAGDGSGAFPTAAAVARIPPARLKSRVRCGYRAVALSRFARRVQSGRLDLASWERPGLAAEDLRDAILAEHGFGPYAAEGLMRILGRHDFLAIDSWVRKRYRQLHRGPAKSVDRAIARRYARYGDLRGLALWLEVTSHWHESPDPIWP
jgi:3-methyladenine DNA glycosylase/8-oxoguanine DNA glycosylase